MVKSAAIPAPAIDQMSQEIHRFEDFELDQSVRELRRNGCVVHLERIPFEFLCLLVERGGQLVTRGEILDRIWGKGVFIHAEAASTPQCARSSGR
jgi:DNA-binding winged helix-turn-helix (wHTH) protein